MYIEFGHSLYGKVDQVPKLFHVATKFFHIYHLPLVPTGSYLVVERGGNNVEYPIAWNARSLLFAWLRVGLMIGGAVSAIAAFVLLLELADRKAVGDWLLTMILVSAVLWFLLWRSYRFTRATPLRALDLAREVGISPEELAPYFVDHEDLSQVHEALGTDRDVRNDL